MKNSLDFIFDAWMCLSFSFMCGLHVVSGLDCLLILGFKKSRSSLISKFLPNPGVIVTLNYYSGRKKKTICGEAPRGLKHNMKREWNMSSIWVQQVPKSPVTVRYVIVGFNETDSACFGAQKGLWVSESGAGDCGASKVVMAIRYIPWFPTKVASRSREIYSGSLFTYLSCQLQYGLEYSVMAFSKSGL